MPIGWPRGCVPPMCGQGGFRGQEPTWQPVKRRYLLYECRYGRPVFRSQRFYGTFSVTGVTKDKNGAVLGDCVVHLFDAATDVRVAEILSDGSGNFVFVLGSNVGLFYIVAYKDGAPDLAGTTINELIAVDQVGIPVDVFLRDPTLPDSGGPGGAGGGSVFGDQGGVIT
jgi:hypothetical protein